MPDESAFPDADLGVPSVVAYPRRIRTPTLPPAIRQGQKGDRFLPRSADASNVFRDRRRRNWQLRRKRPCEDAVLTPATSGVHRGGERGGLPSAEAPLSDSHLPHPSGDQSPLASTRIKEAPLEANLIELPNDLI